VKTEEIRVCILRAPGTNCDRETGCAVSSLGANSEVVHINQVLRKRVEVLDYQGLIIPGGFSFGDHIRSGAILGKMTAERLNDELATFLKEGRPVLGICNGFQVLVEAGILPGFGGISPSPEAALAVNTSSRYEDRWVRLKNESRGNCIFMKEAKKLLRMPVAHGEGKFTLPPGREEELLRRLEEGDQVVFRYALESGEYAKGAYPQNPNGSLSDIAGICNPEGNVLGLMPHPERATTTLLYPEWTRNKIEEGDGLALFRGMLAYIEKDF